MNTIKNVLNRIDANNPVLQVIPNASHNEELYEKVKEYTSKITNYGGWYLHGDLQEDVGYDLATFVDLSDELTRTVPEFTSIYGDDVSYTGEYIRVPYLNGVFRVNVLGIDKPCIGIFWTLVYDTYECNGQTWEHYRQSGLVCYECDVDAVMYALSKEGSYYL